MKQLQILKYRGLFCYHIKLLILTALIIKNAQIYIVSAVNIHYINWNTTNPLFHDYGNNVIDINAGTKEQPWSYEQANIICPRYSSNYPSSKVERYIIYNVSRTEFQHCQVNDPQPNKIVAVCNTPYEFTLFTLTFRAFSPVPGAFEFHPGKNYYFISTSSKRNLYKHSGGRCSTHNMRLMFRIKDVNRGNNHTIEHNISEDDSDTTSIKSSEESLSELEQNQSIEGAKEDYNDYYSNNDDYYPNGYEEPVPIQSHNAAGALIISCDLTLFAIFFVTIHFV